MSRRCGNSGIIITDRKPGLMKKNSSIILIVLLALVLVVSGCKDIGSSKSAPDFDVTLLDLNKGGESVRGKSVSLNDYKGKPLVLNFWAPWCPPCRDESPGFERVYQKYKSKEVKFLAIAIRDTDLNIEQFVKRYGLTFQIGIDADAEIANKYGVSGIPETFFIDTNGNIKRTHVGALSESQLSEYIDEILG